MSNHVMPRPDAPLITEIAPNLYRISIYAPQARF